MNLTERILNRLDEQDQNRPTKPGKPGRYSGGGIRPGGLATTPRPKPKPKAETPAPETPPTTGSTLDLPARGPGRSIPPTPEKIRPKLGPLGSDEAGKIVLPPKKAAGVLADQEKPSSRRSEPDISVTVAKWKAAQEAKKKKKTVVPGHSSRGHSAGPVPRQEETLQDRILNRLREQDSYVASDDPKTARDKK